MKILTTILLLFGINVCQGQTSPQLPNANNAEGANTLQGYVENYQSQTNPPIPLSFVMNTIDLINYYTQLQKQQPNTELYFHVYFGIDPNDLSVVRLIIVPSLQIADDQYILAHDTKFNSVFVPPLFELLNSGTPQPNQFCYTPDQFDANNIPNQCPCFYKTSTSYATSSDLSGPTISIATAKTWVSQYQEGTHHNSDRLSADFIQSITFDATELMDFISNNNVPLLQIYIGQDYSLQKNNNQENYTLVFVGMDLLGNHIPAAGQLGSMLAFEACWPCPVCGVKKDGNIDDQDQVTDDFLKKEHAEGGGPRHQPEHFSHKKHKKQKFNTIKKKQAEYIKKNGRVNGGKR